MFRKVKLFVAMLLVIGIWTGPARAELIGYWPFDENQGTQAADITPNGNHGTLSGGVEWIPGYKDSAVRLDTAGERIVVNELDPTAENNAMTLAIWINWEGEDHATITHQGLFGKRQGWDPRTFVKWFWEAQPDGDLVFRNGDTAVTASGVLDAYSNEWAHAAMTWDNGDVVQYINGEQVNTGNITFRDTADATVVSIGCVSATNSETFVGSLDEARIYSHVLTQEEIQTVMLGEFPTAYSPEPADGAIYEDTWVSLSWKPGTLAVSHDVYLGESFADVNEGAGDTFRGNQIAAFYVAGFPGFAYPDGLVPGTTYYWRIDEVNDTHPDSPWKGDVWSFTVPSRKAYNPNPSDGAKFIATNVTLTWAAGLNTKLHHVYFGDDPDVVANATGAPPQAPATYTPGPLELERTYYWRVDEFDGAAVQTGDVWSFTTLPEIPIADPSLVGWWKFDEGMGDAALDWSGHGNHGALQGDPQWVPGQVGGALEFDGDGDFVDCGNGPDLTITGNITFMCWIKVDAFTKSWETILSKGDDSYRMSRGDQYGDAVHFGCNGPTGGNLNGNSIVTTNTWRHVAMMYDGSNKIIYIDGVEDARVATTGDINTSTYNFFIGENSQQRGRNLTGLVDDVRIYNKALTVEQIKEAMRGEPDLAWNPNPANGSTVYIADAAPLTWSAGDFAAQHDVYFGTDRAAVADADASDTTGVYRNRQNGTSYNPPEGIEWGGGPYYWRIDEVNTDGTISAGRIWTFTVLDFTLVEDFESYTDDDAAGEAIWQHWIDGFGIPSNGSQVGYLLPPYAEQTMVHGGRQSMPLLYNNTAGVMNSEAEFTLTWPRDWTAEDVGELSLWFHGLPGSVGGFVEGPVGTYTMTAEGVDIWNTADEFHYAFKTLSGAGTIEAKVESVQNTNAWAKAGVMIRETLEPGSKFAAVYITPANGCRYQARMTADVAATSDTAVVTPEQIAITAPYWVKLERTVAGGFNGYYSGDGVNWQPMSWNPQSITMASNVYVGLAVTSHSAGVVCEARFSNIRTTGTVGPQWTNQDIGLTSNAADPLYVAISNSGGTSAVVANGDPAATTIDAWTEWRIPLQSFADQGVNLTSVDKIAIGVGSKGGAAAGGAGTVYFDDIRLYRSQAEPQP